MHVRRLWRHRSHACERGASFPSEAALTLMMGASATCASSSSLLASSVYCSMYRRMVAPEDPVPDRRKMMREPSAHRCAALHISVPAVIHSIWPGRTLGPACA